MKFCQNAIEVDRLLKVDKHQFLMFAVYPVEPVEVKEHIFKNSDGKFSVEPCTSNIDNNCPYCITMRTLIKGGANFTDAEVRKWFPRSRYFLPVNVDENPLDIEPGEYVYGFGKQIHSAYMQLLINNDRYKFKIENGLHFTHNVLSKHGYPDYSKCMFAFGKKVLTVEKLCNDTNSRLFI